MKMKKVLALACAISTMAISSAALADGVTATYEDGIASATVTPDAAFTNQVTVIVVPENTETITDADIYYINQYGVDGYEAGLQNLALKADIADGTYEVRIGCSEGRTGDTPYYSGTFTVGGSEPTYLLGDPTEDESIDGSDASWALQYFAELLSDATEDQELAADVNKDEVIDGSDASLILQYFAEIITDFE